MIDFIIGTIAVLLVLLGLAIIAGPELPRVFRGLGALVRHIAEAVSQPPPEEDDDESPRVIPLNPTTQRAMLDCTQIAAILRKYDHKELGTRLAQAAAQLAASEPHGLRNVLTLWRRLERVRVDDEAAQAQLDRLLVELHAAVMDRAEQLELLPFPG